MLGKPKPSENFLSKWPLKKKTSPVTHYLDTKRYRHLNKDGVIRTKAATKKWYQEQDPCTAWEQEWSMLGPPFCPQEQQGSWPGSKTSGWCSTAQHLLWEFGIPLNNPAPLKHFAIQGWSCCHLTVAIQGAFSVLRLDLQSSNPTHPLPSKDSFPSRELSTL